jgi:predicted nucleic acid-binding protein
MANHKSPTCIIVCDAGPLIHLDELAAIDLLSDFTEILVPSVVWKEVERHRPTALANPEVPLQCVSSSDPLPADLQAIARLFTLHQGELRALHLARRRGPDMLLTDDTAARLAARTLNIPVHGTLGVLIRAIRQGRRTAQEITALLRTFPTASTLHVRHSFLEEVIRGINKST